MPVQGQYCRGKLGRETFTQLLPEHELDTGIAMWMLYNSPLLFFLLGSIDYKVAEFFFSQSIENNFFLKIYWGF